MLNLVDLYAGHRHERQNPVAVWLDGRRWTSRGGLSLQREPVVTVKPIGEDERLPFGTFGRLPCRVIRDENLAVAPPFQCFERTKETAGNAFMPWQRLGTGQADGTVERDLSLREGSSLRRRTAEGNERIHADAVIGGPLGPLQHALSRMALSIQFPMAALNPGQVNRRQHGAPAVTVPHEKFASLASRALSHAQIALVPRQEMGNPCLGRRQAMERNLATDFLSPPPTMGTRNDDDGPDGEDL